MLRVTVAFRLIENPSDSPSLIEEVGVYEYVVVQLGEFHIYSRNRDYDRNKFHENLDSKISARLAPAKSYVFEIARRERTKRATYAKLERNSSSQLFPINLSWNKE